MPGSDVVVFAVPTGVAVVWAGSDELRIAIAENYADPPSLVPTFRHARASPGIDEGLRLLDSPDWSSVRALITTAGDIAAPRRST
jgi:hypothetical protein